MADLLKKVLLTGVGVAVMTKDKIEELAQEMVKTGQMTQEEGKKFVNDLIKESEEARKNLESQIEKTVKTQVDTVGLATREDIRRLEEKIEKIMAHLGIEEEKKEESEEESS